MQHGKHTAISLGALLCTVLLALSFGIGQTQARYENAVSWKGIYAPAAQPVFKSNFLAEGGRTVRLSDWTVSDVSYRTFGIQLATDGGQLSGVLACQVDSDLITATLDHTAFTLDKTGHHTTLRLRTTAQAADLTEPTDVTVHITWTSQNSTAWADLKVTLQPSLTAPQTPEVILDDAQQTDAAMVLTVPDTFSLQEGLWMKLKLPQGADRVLLNYNGGAFPENTVYSVDGASEVVLADGGLLEIPTNGLQEMQLKLDFSWTAMRQTRFLLSVVAYAGNEEIRAINKTISSTRKPLESELDAAAIVLGANAQAELPFSGDLDGFCWTFEQLVQTQGGSTYVASDALHIQIEQNTDDTENFVLVITNEHTRAHAGTYRLKAQRVYENTVLSSFEIAIFVYY